MAKHLIMDKSGHSTIEFDPENDGQLKEAMARFKELVGENKYVAATRNAGERDYVIARAFEDTRDETLFKPQDVGG
jgi:hypothetical protein